MASKNVHIADDSTFEAEVLKAAGPVLVDFHATWCGPCKVLAPVVEKLADIQQGKLKVVKVDIDKAPQTARRLQIENVPTVIIFEDGRKMASHVGVANEKKLLSLARLD